MKTILSILAVVGLSVLFYFIPDEGDRALVYAVTAILVCTILVLLTAEWATRNRFSFGFVMCIPLYLIAYGWHRLVRAIRKPKQEEENLFI